VLSIAAAALIAMLIGAMNSGRVAIELAFVHLNASLGFALVVAFVAGLIVGLLWQSYWLADLLSERGRLRRALRVAEDRARGAAAAREDVG